MTISLVHPSRERAVKARATASKWISKMSDDNDVEYILSIDHDDPQKGLYYQWFSIARISIAHNSNVVQAMNAGALLSIGQIIVCISDDFEPPSHWDKLIIDNYEWWKDIAIRVNDTITKEEDLILTLPILSRSLYDKLGYIYHPGFTGMWADNDLAEQCKAMGALINRFDLVFPHNHWVNGKAVKDATYNRHNTTESWNIGTKVIEERRKQRI